MILSFNRVPVAAALAVLLALLALGCARREEGSAPAAKRGASVADLLGVLKLLRQEYGNAVPPAGGSVADPTEYAETEVFAEQAEVKLAALRAAGAVEPGRADELSAILGRARAGVARKAPPAEVAGEITAAIAGVEAMLAGTVPDAIRGTVLAVSRADQAIGAEEVAGEYRIGVTTALPRAVLRRRAGTLVAAEPPTSGAVYLGVVLRERRTKRFLPAATVQVVIDGQGQRIEAPLAALWGDFPQYGANVPLPPDGPVTITVQVAPPAYDRHGDMLNLFVAPVSARLAGHVRAGALSFDARPVQPIDPDYSIGDDVLQAIAEAGELRDTATYRVGLIVEGPEPIWNWKDGRPVLQPVPAGATNHLEVVLMDRETGQLVPSARVTLTFLAGGRPVGTAPLHPLLSTFPHYGETLALPAGTTAARVRIDPPDIGALDHPRLAESAEIELPLPRRREKTA